LAVIGKDWLECKDALGDRRLDDPRDFVRLELALALRRDIPVVPVLVGGAKMPTADRLPEELKELVYRNAVELTHARWKSDVQLLIQALRPYLDEPDSDAAAANRAEAAQETSGLGQETSGPGQETSGPGQEVSPKQAAQGRLDGAALVSSIEAQTMEHIRKELAAYIGPISGVVVKRAAKRCTSVEDLCAILAREIEAEEDRTKFLRSCRS